MAGRPRALVLQRGGLELSLCSPPPGGPWACPWPPGLSSQGDAPWSLLREGGAGPPVGVAMAVVLVTTLHEASRLSPCCRVLIISGITFSFFFFPSSLFSFFTPMKKLRAGCLQAPLVGRLTFGRSANTQSRVRGSHKLPGLRSRGNRTEAWEEKGPGTPFSCRF